ncbi:MAG: aminodeoxychorismate synthase component I [Pseudomonadota bacterium]|nr:aminodeoxychorismate synthase component I [Pseudomonadota bacterium]
MVYDDYLNQILYSGPMLLPSIELPYQADSLTLFERFRQLDSPLLLDSGEGYRDRFDVIAAAPVSSVRVMTGAADTERAFSQMRELLGPRPMVCADPGPAPGWYGVWSYDLGSLSERVPLPRPDNPLPLLWMGFYPALIVLDHRARRAWLRYLPAHQSLARRLQKIYEGPASAGHPAGRFRLQSPFRGNLMATEYQQRFARVQDYIRAGDCYQVNLARRFQAQYAGDPWDAYRRLRRAHSAPMGAFLQVEDWALMSLSPERFIRCWQSQVETRPIKGTRPRSGDPLEDRGRRQELLSSLKDRAENLMIVDLLRNDLGRSCEPGSVQVPELFALESFSNVHHLVSTVQGRLRPELDPLDLIWRAFPGGSITGAPKHRAMEIIAELEPAPREFYCGSLVYLDVTGTLDSSILIRSLVARNATIRCWGGGGIVADSVAEQEFQEIRHKVGSFLKSLTQTSDL